MQPRYVIKLSSKSPKALDKESKSIIVGLNTGKSNGPYIARLGYCRKLSNNKTYYFIDTFKLGLWLNKGAVLKSKVSWIVGLLAQGHPSNYKPTKKSRVKPKLNYPFIREFNKIDYD